MSDTQWPRYYVFEQPEAGRPFIHAGSVHAPDGEMALLIARDVFGRRPERTAMWVARDIRIFSRTREELDAGVDPVEETGQAVQVFHVFAKRSHKGTFVQAAEIEAGSPEAALQAALDRAEVQGAAAWWVIADAALVHSTPDDRPALYESSPGKDFRHENHYPVRTMMMELKNRKRG